MKKFSLTISSLLLAIPNLKASASPPGTTRVEISGAWLQNAAKVHIPNKTALTNSGLMSETGKVMSFSPNHVVNGKVYSCSTNENYIDPRLSSENPKEDFDYFLKPLANSCRNAKGEKLTLEKFRPEIISIGCDGEDSENTVTSLNIIDDETMVGNVNTYFMTCLKRIDVSQLKLSSYRAYSGSKGVRDYHEFAFNFPFKIPAQLTASQGNSGQSVVTLQFHDLGAKEVTKCTYKGDAPKAKKSQPIPVSKNFVFEKCSNGAAANNNASGAFFSLQVNGGPQLAGADRTQVDLTLTRIAP